jgi:sugar O-acyltransferase (sialic acid O-acetyltransferase NeuD family)
MRLSMEGVVVYATGSPILVDIEESLFRAGIPISAGVQNRPGESFLSDASLLLSSDALPDEYKQCPFIVPLFTPRNRQVAALEAEQLGFKQPFSLIDPSVAAPRTLRYAPGLFVNAGCSLGGRSEYSAFVFINRGAAVGHHANLGSFVSIGPGAVIGGQVTIGNGSMIGAGSVVLPQITIGQNALVGAGAVVTHDVPNCCLVVGNPARVVKTGMDMSVA